MTINFTEVFIIAIREYKVWFLKCTLNTAVFEVVCDSSYLPHEGAKTQEMIERTQDESTDFVIF